MKERGIIFNAENREKVRLGTKTLTSRIIKPQPVYHDSPKCNPKYNMEWQNFVWAKGGSPPKGMLKYARHAVGDHLYMLEPYQVKGHNATGCNFHKLCLPHSLHFIYLDDDIETCMQVTDRDMGKFLKRKKPNMKTSSRFMYKSLARTWVEVTEVWVSRLQDMTEQDCIDEGCEAFKTLEEYKNEGSVTRAKWMFEKIWESIHGKGS